ncbi:2TM domain-containing protein [Soonwooa buanensis]|uniref:2TM domain-containing protein n=1 Tax=Soonwooa buanensis TaxID=619805 RepID=A0A1T5FTW7_9FLAO|nr:2TM domain-containing protein [Soonwooa buanensis]SKB99586.1 2TM domain-containing protein [Soonwooa buanensis]
METELSKIKLNRAKSRVEELKAFYIMLAGYVVLVPFLIYVNQISTPDLQWFWIPVLGAGSGILAYAILLFYGNKWEDKKIKEILVKENQK